MKAKNSFGSRATLSVGGKQYTIYRLDAVGTIQRTKEKKIQVHIRGIWDVEHVNQNTTSADPNDLPAAFADRIPLCESSIAAARAGSTPSLRAASR